MNSAATVEHINEKQNLFAALICIKYRLSYTLPQGGIQTCNPAILDDSYMRKMGRRAQTICYLGYYICIIMRSIGHRVYCMCLRLTHSVPRKPVRFF